MQTEAPGAGLEAADEGSPPEELCPACGGRGWVVVTDGGAGRARPCECRKRNLSRRLLDGSGIPVLYRRCRLDNFQTGHPDRRIADRLQQALRTSQLYVDSFFDLKRRHFRESGLIYIGPPGVGKTHLAAAVLSELIRRYQARGRFVDFTALLHQIQSTFDPSSPESAHQVLDPVIGAEILVLDELGAQKTSEWVMNTLYLIMNSRYTKRRPTIFTTNYLLDDDRERERNTGAPEMSDQVVRRRDLSTTESRRPTMLSTRLSARLVSRLYEMALPVRLPDWDYRREVLKHRHRVGT